MSAALRKGSSMTDSYAEFQTDKLDTDKLTGLTNLVTTMREEETAVADLEAKLKHAKERLRDVAERQIPDLMDEVGLKDFVTSEGLKVTIKRTIRASIPTGNKESAMAWLDDHGHGALIKRMVNVAFNPDEEDKAAALMQDLKSDFPMVKTDRRVESATLRAFIREKIEAGDEIPLELFGAWEQRIAKVEVKK